MNFRWLKSILPKGLYGRAALIMIVPVITIQLVVSLVFIQRHFDGVTRQLTANVALALDYLLDRLNRANDPTGVIRDVATPLGYLVSPVAVMPTADALAFDDLTGANVIAVLHAQLSEMVRVDLKSLDRRVVLYATANGNPYRIEFDRSRVSASNPHQLLVLMIVTSLVMTLISFMFLRNQVRPIRRLAKAADAFGKGRRIAYHISGATEVRQAGHAFVRMRDRIERQIEQRTLMLSGVSHDLRTPLTRLKLGLSLAGRSDETEAMMQDVDEMQAMLEEFLAFARGDNLEETALSDPWSLAAQVAGNVGRTDGKVSLGDRPPSATPILVTMRPNAVLTKVAVASLGGALALAALALFGESFARATTAPLGQFAVIAELALLALAGMATYVLVFFGVARAIKLDLSALKGARRRSKPGAATQETNS